MLVTPMAMQALADAETHQQEILDRHFTCDWGDLDPDDAVANDQAIDTGARILSAYNLPTGVRVWVLTEAISSDGVRKVTTILLPTEY